MFMLRLSNVVKSVFATCNGCNCGKILNSIFKPFVQGVMGTQGLPGMPGEKGSKVGI